MTTPISEKQDDMMAEVLMEISESGLLEFAGGCDLMRDKQGWYIGVTSLYHDKVNLPETFKGMRLKLIRPPKDHGHVQRQTKTPLRASHIERRKRKEAADAFTVTQTD